jgi:transglutaminase-like putative cysteine protease
MQSTQERTTEIALCCALTCIAGAVYADFFSGWHFLVPVIAGALGPALVMSATAARGWRPGRSAALVLVLLPVAGATLLYAVPDAGIGGGTGGIAEALATFRDGVGQGWSAMLDAGLPADLRGELIVTPFVLSWLACAAAALLAVHTEGPIIPLGPPTLALVAALALTGSHARHQLAVGLAFLFVALALMLVRANRVVSAALTEALSGPGSFPGGSGDRASSPNAARLHTPAGRVAFGVPLVVGIAVASPLAAGALPPARGDRLDPRDLRDERFQIDDALSPLVLLKSQLKAEPPQPLFRISIEAGGDAPDRVRTAALDAYDGALWTTTGDYRRAGSELPGDAVLGHVPPGARVRQSITILGLEGPFLPAAGRPLRLDGDLDEAVMGFDATAGTLVSARTHLRGLSYALESAVVAPSDDELAAATPGSDPALDALRATPPNLPANLVSLAQAWTEEAPSRAGELLALRDGLRAIRYDDSVDAEPGHNYDALERVLLGDETEREGYAEQFAAAFAVLARTRGFPTRVVTGYLLPEPGPDGDITVTEADAHAWPEVYLDDLGWVPIEATGHRRESAPEPDDVQAPPGRPSNAPSDASQASPPVPPAVVEATVDGESDGGSGGVMAPAAAGGMAAFVALAGLFALPALAKRWRSSRRRRAASASARVVGAWRETLDRLVELGVPVAPSLTASEVAARARARFPQGASAVGQLVPLVAVAVYAPFEPEGAAADHAWRLASDARSSLRRGIGPGRRLRAMVDPRPLLGPGRQVRRADRVQTASPTAVAAVGDAAPHEVL